MIKLINLCCGNVRPQSTEEVQFVNVDTLHKDLFIGTPERSNLDKEGNYIDMDVETYEFFDFARNNKATFDGIVASHCVEHWDCQSAVMVMARCHKLLKPGGALLVSVPDASYFRLVHEDDTVENAVKLFGEPIHLPDGETTFFGYGLWNRFHKAILTEDALWAYFKRAGFTDIGNARRMECGNFEWVLDMLNNNSCPLGIMSKLLNRIPFSLIMAGVKP